MRSKKRGKGRKRGGGNSIRSAGISTKSPKSSSRSQSVNSGKDIQLSVKSENISNEQKLTNFLNENGLNYVDFDEICEKKNTWNNWRNLATFGFYRRQYNLEKCKKNMLTNKLKKLGKNKLKELGCDSINSCIDTILNHNNRRIEQDSNDDKEATKRVSDSREESRKIMNKKIKCSQEDSLIECNQKYIKKLEEEEEEEKEEKRITDEVSTLYFLFTFHKNYTEFLQYIYNTDELHKNKVNIKVLCTKLNEHPDFYSSYFKNKQLFLDNIKKLCEAISNTNSDQDAGQYLQNLIVFHNSNKNDSIIQLKKLKEAYNHLPIFNDDGIQQILKQQILQDNFAKFYIT